MWRFVVTGGLAAIVDFGLYMVLYKVGWACRSTCPRPLSFVVGTITAYLINRRWTFQAAPSTARFVAVMVLYAITFAVRSASTTCAWCFCTTGGGRYRVAFVIAQGTATVINFIVQRAVIFRIR